MPKTLMLPIAVLLFFLIDLYVYQAVKTVINEFHPITIRYIKIVYWSITFLSIAGFIYYHAGNPYLFGKTFRIFLLGSIFINYFSKLFVVIFLFIDDIIRGGKWLLFKGQKIVAPESTPIVSEDMSRSDFIAKTGLAIGTIPLVAMTYGIVSGAYDYKVRKVTINLPNLPKAFHGLRIAQLSDIHSGSFYNKKAVQGGIDMLMKEKPDVIFFTGDLVNNKAEELAEYVDVFSKVKAPLGVFSVLGNHDYGDYVQWSSMQAKQKNLEDLKQGHKVLGWDLLLNENRILTMNGEKIAIIGVENYGAKGNFPKYGKIAPAHEGLEDIPVKLLLSHDPSHWDYQINKHYKDVDVMFSGHTHGFQFGVEIAGIKWSPVQYMYAQWGGLYQKENQYLYVNRGFGFLGFPGRIGMPPEITIFEFRQGNHVIV